MALGNGDEDQSPYPSDGEPGESSPGVIDTDDGGAIVKTGEPQEHEPPADEDDFYRNLVPELDPTELSRLGLELYERIEFDKQSREDRDKKYEEGIKRTGLGDEVPGGASFVGASVATHPMLSKAILSYQSHTIQELMPPGGPVHDDIPGTVTPQRVEKGRRKSRHMNWQFKRQMPEFRSELEKLLSQQLPAGSQYMRLVYDSDKERPIPKFWPQDLVFLPEAASDFYSAERRTFADSITQHEFESRMRQGYYKPMPVVAPSMGPDKTKSERATAKVQGVSTTSAQNEDGLRRIYICEVLASLEAGKLRIAGDQRTSDVQEILAKEESLPYLIELDVQTKEIVRAVRNWEKDDDKHQNLCWAVDFECFPWRGAQSVGWIHYASSLAGAGTGALRSLLDTALIQNIPSLLKLKGVNAMGQTLDVNVCQITEIEGSVTGDPDIRKWVMPIPFNPPSTMLYQLLGWCTEQGEGLIRTALDNIAEDGAANMPVGTTLALIEQGLRVFAALHIRLHAAMDRLIGILHRINRMFITDEEIKSDTGEMLAYREDYEGPVDVVPVSDPQVFSDIQRFAQLQIIQQRADLHPELYDARKVEELILERTKVPNAKDLLVPKPQVHELNAVNENVAMTLGRPVAAFPEQDHLAHIQVHLDYLTSPLFGFLSIIAPKFIPACLQHLVEHLAYWYLTYTVEISSHAAQQDVGKLTKFKDPHTKQEMDQTLASASTHTMKAAQSALGKIPQVVQQAQAILKQFMPPQPMDPSQTAVQVAQTNANAKQSVAQQQSQDKQKQQQADAQTKLQQTAIQEQNQNQRTAAEVQSHENINREDNVTALEIAAARVEEGHAPGVSTGTGLEGHEGPNFGGGK